MLKKAITYQNFLTGKEVTENFYFHLSKAEIIELELDHKGGLSEHIKKIVTNSDAREIVAMFKKVILSSVGRRSEDNKFFIKNEQVYSEFVDCGAYSSLFTELLTDPEAGVEFIKKIVPSDLVDELVTTVLDTKYYEEPLPPVTEVDIVPLWVKQKRMPNQTEVRDMTKEELQNAYLSLVSFNENE